MVDDLLAVDERGQLRRFGVVPEFTVAVLQQTGESLLVLARLPFREAHRHISCSQDWEILSDGVLWPTQVEGVDLVPELLNV